MATIILVFVLLAVLILLLPRKSGYNKQMSPGAFFAVFLLILAALLYFLNR